MTTTDVSDALEHLKLAADVAGVRPPEFVLPEGREVVLRGMRFHYLDWGTTGKLPIVFLHGGALNAHTWDLVCLALRRDYHCLALDQRGHGNSEWSPEMDYRFEAYVGDLEAFVDHLALDRFALVGMSLGAVVTASYASRHSGRLAAAIIIDAGPEPMISGAKRIRDFVAETMEFGSMDEFVDRALAFNPRRDPRLLRRSLLYNLRRAPDGRWVRKNDTRHMVDGSIERLIADASSHWADVSSIACPTLVVRGAESDVLSADGATKLVESLPAGCGVTIPGAGHTVQGDNPRDLIAALREFLQGDRRIGGDPFGRPPGGDK